MAGLLGAILGGGIGLAKGIYGAVQAAKANKQVNSLIANRPQYNISKGYMNAYNTAKQMAVSELPGYQRMKEQIGQSSARAMDYAREGAMGSNQYLTAALGAQDKELDAIKNLGIASAEWRAKQQQQLMGAQNQMGQLQDVEFQTNQLSPWGIKMNMAAENKQAGLQNMFGGLQDMGGAINNFVGTNSYLDTLKGLYPNFGGSNGATVNQPQNNPVAQAYMKSQGQYSPQANLMGSVRGMGVNNPFAARNDYYPYVLK